MYRSILGQNQAEKPELEYINAFQSHFVPQDDFSAKYLFEIEGQKKPLLVAVDKKEIQCQYQEAEDVDIFAKLSASVMTEITSGRMTFQRAFGTGEMTARGTLRNLRMLDNLFPF